MPLAPVLKCPLVLSLVPSSGIQIIDLGFKAGRSADVRTSWAFYDAGGGPPVRVEDPDNGAATTYEVDLGKLVETYRGAWTPIPVFREEPGGDWRRGPTNWARVHLCKLDEVDENGFDHRILVAFDTELLPHREDEAYLAPSEQDARRGAVFSVCRSEEVLDWYVQEKWIADWCREAVRDMVTREEQKRRPSTAAASDEQIAERLEGPGEDIACYKALVYLLADLDLLPQFKILDQFTTPPEPVKVDLVLDVGNSRTCGILIETHPDGSGADINRAEKVALRDLSEPTRVYTDPFESRIEFNRASFGKEDISFDSGRPVAFSWPTVVRIGPEALRLAGLRRGGEGATGLSSPKRYLWDDDPRRDSWRFNNPADHGEDTPMATGVEFTTLVNDTGEPLHTVPSPPAVPEHDERRFPAFQALYARRNLMSFALTEVFLQTIVMMNSAAHRLRQDNAMLPRRLRRIIMTMPTALPLAERQILRRQAENARDLAYLCLGSGDPEEDGSEPIEALRKEAPLPEIKIDWDEASATQAVFLYSQTAMAYSGDARAFFQRSRLPVNRSSGLEDEFRLATLDIGGGTTDLVVTAYRADGRGANVTLFPKQIFREGLSVAGDDIVFRVIQDHVLAPIMMAMEGSGISISGAQGDRVKSLADRLFGGDRGGMHVEERHYRQQFAVLVGLPAALRLIAEYEDWDPLSGPTDGETFCLSELFGDTGTVRDVIEFVERKAQEAGGSGFDLARVEIPVRYQDIDRTVRSVVLELLRACAEIVYRARADLLILSGRPSRMPAVSAILTECMALPPHRVIPLHDFQVGSWYPFRDYASTISDPKTTAAVGAMICLLGEGLLKDFNFRSDHLKAGSTAKYFGKLDRDNRLHEDDVFFRDLDLDRKRNEYDNPEDWELPDEPFEFRGPMTLGFRQFDADWWPGTRLYSLDYASPDIASKLNPRTPLRVTLRRNELGENRAIVDAFMIYRIEDKDGKRIGKNELRLRLQTIDNQDGYWLDTGILLNR